MTNNPENFPYQLEAPKNAFGRPSKYTPEIVNEICKLIAHGKSLVSVCKILDIGYSTVKDWLSANSDFSAMYAHAREEQADYLADEIISLIDEEPAKTLNKAGHEVIDSGWVSNQKNRVDARKWAASKLKPRKYGDRFIQAGDPDAPIQHTHAVRYIKPDGTNP